MDPPYIFFGPIIAFGRLNDKEKIGIRTIRRPPFPGLEKTGELLYNSF